MTSAKDAPTVFIVEDEDAFIEALDIGLQREGFRVEVARDGAEALLNFESVNPDIILLDGDPLEGYWNWLKTAVVVKAGKVVVDKR